MDKMGDMLLSLPAIKSIKNRNTNFIIDVLASNDNSKVLQNLSYIDKVIKIDTKSGFISLIKKLFYFRESVYDLHINLSPTI